MFLTRIESRISHTEPPSSHPSGSTRRLAQMENVPDRMDEIKLEFREIDYDKDFDAVLALYVRAFSDQKMFLNLSLSTPEQHKHFMTWLTARRLDLLARRKDVTSILLGLQDGRIVAAVGMEPHSTKFTLYDQICVGFLLLPFKFGLGVLHRVMALDSKNTVAIADTAVDELGAKVTLMAVEPELHGKGIGGQLIRKRIELWDAEGRGELSLLTQLESNTKFYSKYGFDVMSVEERDGYTNWIMRRLKPSPPSESGHPTL